MSSPPAPVAQWGEPAAVLSVGFGGQELGDAVVDMLVGMSQSRAVDGQAVLERWLSEPWTMTAQDAKDYHDAKMDVYALGDVLADDDDGLGTIQREPTWLFRHDVDSGGVRSDGVDSGLPQVRLR